MGEAICFSLSRPSAGLPQQVRDNFSHGQLARLWIKYPPPDAAVVDPGNPRRFHRATEWTVFNVAPEGMRIEDGGGHSGNHEKMVTAPSAPADQGPGYLLAV